MSIDPTRRFSDRVANYVRYRPGYPPGVVRLIGERCGVEPGAHIADVGAGTGIFTALLLEGGYRVSAIEPNPAMRAVAEERFRSSPRFTSLPGSAEETGLAHRSVALVAAAQAFHWFHAARSRAEWLRVLRPGGRALLVWNERKNDASPFLREYEALLHEHGTDYGRVHHKNLEAGDFEALFGHDRYDTELFDNEQEFNEAGLVGRHLSSSYVPLEGQPGYEEGLTALRALFRRHEKRGRVRFEYVTRVHHGPLEGDTRRA